MRISPGSALSSLIAAALIVALCFGVRSELTQEPPLSRPPLTQMAAGLRAEADLYCYVHQGDGCWSDADIDEIDEHDQRIAARNNR
jgi:hypothetical protein